MKKIARLLARALLRFLIAQARARNPLGAFSALATSICQRILQRQISPSIAAPASNKTPSSKKDGVRQQSGSPYGVITIH